MNPAEVSGKDVTVVGAARSGLAVARLLADAGARVFLTEQGPAAGGLEAELAQEGIACEFGGHSERTLEADFFAISPGVPSTAPLVQKAQERGVPVYSEIEVASWFCDKPIIAITGTNGKTTTTSLTGHVFRQAGCTPLVAGNIGTAFSEQLRTTGDFDVAVLEVSSFQLDHIDRFRPAISVLLNITPDHLDRYQNNFDIYTNSKYRIFENQQAGDVLVYNHDDERSHAGAQRAVREKGLNALAFSHQQEVERGAFVRDDAIILRLNDEERLMHINDLALHGNHNVDNALAAAIAARVMEVNSDDVRQSLSSFEGVPHRLETVRVLDGVQYVNDSKATNVNAVWYALESFHEPLILIAGGRDKGNDYSQLKPLIKRNVRAVLALGESAQKVQDELGALAPISRKVSSMEAAVHEARQLGRPGDVVLLSPACASFDMFDDFEDRGDTFRQLVMEL